MTAKKDSAKTAAPKSRAKTPRDPKKDVAAEILLKYECLGVAPDADGDGAVEVSQYRERGGKNAFSFVAKGFNLITWRGRLPFVILFEDADWENFLALTDTANEYLWDADDDLMALKSITTTDPRLPQELTLRIKSGAVPTGSTRELKYRVVDNFPAVISMHFMSASMARATIVLQE